MIQLCCHSLYAWLFLSYFRLLWNDKKKKKKKKKLNIYSIYGVRSSFEVSCGKNGFLEEYLFPLCFCHWAQSRAWQKFNTRGLCHESKLTGTWFLRFPRVAFIEWKHFLSLKEFFFVFWNLRFSFFFKRQRRFRCFWVKNHTNNDFCLYIFFIKSFPTYFK